MKGQKQNEMKHWTIALPWWQNSRGSLSTNLSLLVLKSFEEDLCLSLWVSVICSGHNVSAIWWLLNLSLKARYWPMAPIVKQAAWLIYCHHNHALSPWSYIACLEDPYSSADLMKSSLSALSMLEPTASAGRSLQSLSCSPCKIKLFHACRSMAWSRGGVDLLAEGWIGQQGLQVFPGFWIKLNFGLKAFNELDCL